MRASLLLLFLSGCALLSNLQAPLQIKAIIEGEIKGYKIRCEKNLELRNGHWSVMCGLDNDISIKYRVKNLGENQSKIEFLVGRTTERRIIAAPTLIVKNRPVQSATLSGSTNLLVTAEYVQP